jgi:hypothetical protein
MDSCQGVVLQSVALVYNQQPKPRYKQQLAKKRKSTEDTQRFFGITYAMEEGDISWKRGMIMWIGSTCSDRV